MRNTFLNTLNEFDNYKHTENGAVARKSTGEKLYDMFATGAAYRNRTDVDCILLFKNAFEENPLYALKCLFYIRDCRGGQGERRFFRVCFKWLAKNYPRIAAANIENVPTFGRYDDLFYTCMGTSVENDVISYIKEVLAVDVNSKTPSLLAKWLPSENASASTTKRMARKIRKELGMTARQYRKTLSILRGRINIVERLMSENRWDEIEFDKIPSKAGLIYRNAFARRDIIAKKYETFAKSADTKVNAATLYPYEVVSKATKNYSYYGSSSMSETERNMINKYWENLPDYLEGEPCKMLCVVDTSGSMTWSCTSGAQPIDVAIGLGMYCAERIGGDFHNKFISFSQTPQFINIEGVDFVDKARRIYKRNECSNTDLVRTFNVLLAAALQSDKKDIPETIVVISDMEIDSGMSAPNYSYWDRRSKNAKHILKTDMESMREKWARHGLKMPKLVYWNVDARNNTFLDDGPNVTYVSGCSPTIFKQVITGKTGMDLMFEVLDADRYSVIKA